MFRTCPQAFRHKMALPLFSDPCAIFPTVFHGKISQIRAITTHISNFDNMIYVAQHKTRCGAQCHERKIDTFEHSYLSIGDCLRAYSGDWYKNQEARTTALLLAFFPGSLQESSGPRPTLHGKAGHFPFWLAHSSPEYCWKKTCVLERKFLHLLAGIDPSQTLREPVSHPDSTVHQKFPFNLMLHNRFCIYAMFSVSEPSLWPENSLGSANLYPPHQFLQGTYIQQQCCGAF
jgi:hypothetical protein